MINLVPYVVAVGAVVAPLPDYARLALTGDGMWQDSLCLAVQAASRLLGREAGYPDLFCASGNAFAPAIDLAEDCTAHWHCEARLADRAMARVAAAAGLSARRLQWASTVPDGDEDVARRDAARAVRRALDRGSVVLATGGWDFQGPHGLTHWAWAGIVTSADPETGRILGAHLNGHRDNPIRWPDRFWELRPAPASAPCDDGAALVTAVARIRGRAPFASGGRAVFGLRAVEAWDRHMRTVEGFCGPCWGRHLKDPANASSWGDAVDNARRQRHGAEVAAAWLRGRAAVAPEAARPCLERAARRYDRVAALLGAHLEGGGPEGYAAVLGSLQRQRAHADAVLVPLRGELAAAADEMAAAARAMR